MAPIHLFPANGLHCDHYQSMCSGLNGLIMPVKYLPHDPKNPPLADPFSWDDLLLQKNDLPTNNGYGIGHSLGGTILLHDALLHPYRWRAIVVIDPALFSPFINRMYACMRFLGIEDWVHPMVKRTQKRRTQFESINSVFNRWRQRQAFSLLSDQQLHQFILASLTQNQSGQYQLRFSKEWEASIYRNMCSLDSFIWQKLPALKTQLIVITGASSNTFLKGAQDKLRPYCSEWVTVPNTSHMVPFEAPEAINAIIQTGLIAL